MSTPLSASTQPEADNPYLAMLNGPPEQMKPWFFSSLAYRTEEALATTKSDLQEHATQVRAAISKAFREAPAVVRNAMLGDDGALTGIQVAYHLGHLSFAQLLLDSTLGRRADDDFVGVVNSERFRSLTQALLSGDCAELGIDALVAATGLTELEVRRRMQELIHKGAADFRRWGGIIRYFLTHAGKAAAARCAQDEFSELVTGQHCGPLVKALARAGTASVAELIDFTGLSEPQVLERITQLKVAGAVAVTGQPVTRIQLTLAGKAAFDATRV